MIIPNMAVQSRSSGTPSGPLIQHISFFNHQAVVNGTPAETHFDGEHYHWQRQNDEGQQEHGVIKLFAHGLMGNGVVSSAGSSMPFSASAMFRYVVSIDNQVWIHFEMGFVPDDQGQRHAFGTFVIPGDPSAGEALNKATTTLFTIVQSDRHEDVLHVHFDVDPTYCSFGFSKWIGGDFNFTLDYSRFSGCVYEYDEGAADYHGRRHDLSGVFEDTSAISDLKSGIQAYHAMNPPQSPSLKTRSLAFPQGLAQARALAPDVGGSVEDLFTLPVPDLENLHQLSFAKLKSLMLYTISDDWRKWFGEKKPGVGPNAPLAQSDADLANNPDIKNFLVDKFAVGYLTQAFSLSTDPGIKSQFDSLPGFEEKLNYFWKGSADGCFANSKGYNLATAALTDSAFAVSVPGLSKYLSDKPEVWARKLYDYCTTPFTLNGLALQNTLDGRKRLTHLCSLLHCLDPQPRISTSEGKTVGYATSLYSRVMDVRLNFIIDRFSPDNQEEGVAFLTEFFRQYFNSILAGGAWQDEVLAAAQADLSAVMAEYQVDNVNDLVNKMGDIIADSMEVMIRFKDLPFEAKINAWAKNNPRLSASLGSAVTIGIYGFGIFTSIQAFMGWGELKPQEKAQAIADVVAVSANIFSDIAKFTAAKTLSSAQAAITEVMQAGTEIRAAAQLQKATDIAGQMGVKIEVQLADLAQPALGQGGLVAGEELARAGSLEQTAAKWQRFTKVAGAFAQGMTVLALGAACVVTGFQIVNDFATGQPAAIKVLDILEAVANGVAFLVEIGAGFAALAGAQVCSVIPIIGVVAAIVGIIIAIVLLFIHRYPPPTPEEEFVRDHSVPFVKSLPVPPAEWLAEQKKIAKHLGGSAAVT